MLPAVFEISKKYPRFEGFMVLKIQVEVVQVVMPHYVVVGYKHFREPCYHPEYRGSNVFQNVGILPQHCTVS